MIKFEKITPGMTLYDVHSTRMGNTTMRTMGVWHVRVIEVDAERRRALVSWNTNSPVWWNQWELSKLRAKQPVLVGTLAKRLQTRAERLAAKEPK